MIEPDDGTVSGCGIHMRTQNGVGSSPTGCHACVAMVFAARTEPITQRGSGRQRNPNTAVRNAHHRNPRSTPWVGRAATTPSERSTALYTKSGATIGSRGRG